MYNHSNMYSSKKDIKGLKKNNETYTSREIWKHFNHIKPREKDLFLTEREFLTVTSAVTLRIAKAILEGKKIRLPYGCGCLSLIKFDNSAYINKKGKVVKRGGVNWTETYKLWEEDEEAKRDKILIKHECDYTYKICFIKTDSFLPNNYYIDFLPSINLMREVGRKMSNGTIPDVPMYQYK